MHNYERHIRATVDIFESGKIQLVEGDEHDPPGTQFESIERGDVVLKISNSTIKGPNAYRFAGNLLHEATPPSLNNLYSVCDLQDCEEADREEYYKDYLERILGNIITIVRDGRENVSLRMRSKSAINDLLEHTQDLPEGRVFEALLRAIEKG